MAEQAIYLSTAGMLLGYGVETVNGTKPTKFSIIQGATSLSEISSEKEQIEVTPLSATEYKEYVGGLADSGGNFDVGFNESNVLHKVWPEIISKYKEAKAANLRVWFEMYHPDMTEAFYIIGEPNGLGFGGAEVSSAFQTTGRITINSVEGWSTAIEPTDE